MNESFYKHDQDHIGNAMGVPVSLFEDIKRMVAPFITRHNKASETARDFHHLITNHEDYLSASQKKREHYLFAAGYVASMYVETGKKIIEDKIESMKSLSSIIKKRSTLDEPTIKSSFVEASDTESVRHILEKLTGIKRKRSSGTVNTDMDDPVDIETTETDDDLSRDLPHDPQSMLEDSIKKMHELSNDEIDRLPPEVITLFVEKISHCKRGCPATLHDPDDIDGCRIWQRYQEIKGSKE